MVSNELTNSSFFFFFSKDARHSEKPSIGIPRYYAPIGGEYRLTIYICVKALFTVGSKTSVGEQVAKCLCHSDVD